MSEIIVVDDASTDGTPAILKRLEAEIPSLRVLEAGPLPEGWLGKSHALTVGAQVATGDWLLLTDADVKHYPGSLTTTLGTAERSGAGMLSLSPRQETPTWWEKSVIPCVYIELASLFPFRKVNDPHSPAAAANGQYILIRREVYDHVGGHAAVRSEVLEDVELARRVKAAGRTLIFLPGAGLASARMYRRFGELWHGWTKNLYLLYGGSAYSMLKSAARNWTLGVLIPALYVTLLITGISQRGRWSIFMAAALCLLILVVELRRYQRALGELGFDPALGNWRPAGAALLGMLLFGSLWAYRGLGRVTWKGRTYTVAGGKRGAAPFESVAWRHPAPENEAKTHASRGTER